MKKYFVLTAVLFSLACNSNTDKESTKPDETESPNKFNTSNEKEESGSGALSGKFEIIKYKKDNVIIELPKSVVKFTKNGDVVKSDGVSYFYKIEGDSILFLTSPGHIAYKSKIDFLKDDKTSFIIKTPLDNTEITYKKSKD